MMLPESKESHGFNRGSMSNWKFLHKILNRMILEFQQVILRRDRKNPTDILDRIDLQTVTNNLRKLLEIRNKEERIAELDDIHAKEIKEYLKLLDLIKEIDDETFTEYR